MIGWFALHLFVPALAETFSQLILFRYFFSNSPNKSTEGNTIVCHCTSVSSVDTMTADTIDCCFASLCLTFKNMLNLHAEICPKLASDLILIALWVASMCTFSTQKLVWSLEYELYITEGSI